MRNYVRMKQGIKKCLKFAISPVFWLGVWLLAAWAVGQPLLLPGPWTVLSRLLTLARTADFWLSVGATLWRVFLGLFWGAAAGGILAALTHVFPPVDAVASPAIRVVRATPVVSFILLVYLWVARAAIPWVISGLMVLPVVWGALSAGLGGMDEQLLELARAYRFSRLKTLRLVCLPALRSHFSAGLLTAFGLAWKSGVAAEVLCPPPQAIGSRIQQAKLGLETAELLAWTLAIAALSLALEGVLRRVLERGRGG